MIQKGNTRGNAEIYKNKRKEEKKIHKKKKIFRINVFSLMDL